MEERDSAAAPARRRGRPRKVWHITVRAIDPDKYPDLQKNPENPFATMDAEARIAEIDSFCARLLARACMEAVRRKLTTRAADTPPAESK